MSPQAPTGLRFVFGSLSILIRPVFFLVPALGAMSLGMTKGLSWGGIVLVSVLVHELGHAMAMRAFGFSAFIELHALGGLTHFMSPTGRVPITHERFVVTLAGPLSGLMLGIAMLFFLDTQSPESLRSWVIDMMVRMNLFWSVVNLAPILPWDGGLLVDSGLELLTGRRRPMVVGTLSVVTAVVVLVLAVASSLFLLGFFALQGAMAGWQVIAAHRRSQHREQAWQLVLSGQPKQGEQLAQRWLDEANDATEIAQLVEIIAWARLHQHDVAGARRMLSSVPGMVPSIELQARLAAAEGQIATVIELLEPHFLSGAISSSALALLVSALVAEEQPARVVQGFRALLDTPSPSHWESALHEAVVKVFQSGAYEAALELSLLAANRFRTPVHAFNAACALARLGRADEGVDWLQRAIDLGYAERRSLETDDDLAALRNHPRFAELLARVGAVDKNGP